MPTVSLSEIPGPGDDLEDYVAALFQAAGYFVEKSLIERDPMEVLELDIVATDYRASERATVIAEVKGGSWGFPDLFKLVGWMKYLDTSHGGFFVSNNSNKDIEKVSAKMADLGVSLVHLHDFSDAAHIFEDAGFRSIPESSSMAVWRHAYGIERRIARYLSATVRANPELEGARAALEYHRLVSDGVFFANSPVEQATLLYEAYKEHPRLSLATARELSGKPFEPDCPIEENKILREALLSGDHKLLQACFYVEHRARLAILRAAIDLLYEYPSGEPSADIANSDLVRALFNRLPGTFHAGMEWLRDQESWQLYALLWQQFLWGWGGFYISDRAAEEFDLFSAFSGVPADEFPTALKAFDKFFPSDWFISPGLTRARRIRMMPVYFSGLGVYHRRLAYGWGRNLPQEFGTDYTKQDLARWNNITVKFLQ